MRRLLWTVFFSLLLATASLQIVFPIPAQASACSTEEGIFWGATSNGSWRQSYGVDNSIQITDRDINTNCSAAPYPLGISTAHMDFTIFANNFVELGYREGWYRVTTNHIFWIFTEYYNKGNLVDLTDEVFTGPCDLPVGNYANFRATSFQGTTNWNMKVDCNDGTGYHSANEYDNTCCQKATPEAETSRYGGTATGMSDRQSPLQYRDYSYSSWTDWSGLACVNDDASNWNGEQAGNPYTYDTYKSTSYSCPAP